MIPGRRPTPRFDFDSNCDSDFEHDSLETNGPRTDVQNEGRRTRADEMRPKVSEEIEKMKNQPTHVCRPPTGSRRTGSDL